MDVNNQTSSGHYMTGDNYQYGSELFPYWNMKASRRNCCSAKYSTNAPQTAVASQAGSRDSKGPKIGVPAPKSALLTRNAPERGYAAPARRRSATTLNKSKRFRLPSWRGGSTDCRKIALAQRHGDRIGATPGALRTATVAYGGGRSGAGAEDAKLRPRARRRSPRRSRGVARRRATNARPPPHPAPSIARCRPARPRCRRRTAASAGSGDAAA